MEGQQTEEKARVVGANMAFQEIVEKLMTDKEYITLRRGMRDGVLIFTAIFKKGAKKNGIREKTVREINELVNPMGVRLECLYGGEHVKQ